MNTYNQNNVGEIKIVINQTAKGYIYIAFIW